MKQLEELKVIAYKLFEKLKIEIFFGKDSKLINEDIDNRVWAYCKGYQDCQIETKDIAIAYSQFRDIYKRYESQKIRIYHQKIGGITSWVGDSDETIYNKFLLGEQHCNPLTNEYLNTL